LWAEGILTRIPVRLYRTTKASDGPLILFIHGGGFVFGNLETHDAICRLLAIHSGALVAAIDYGLAPENQYPVALNDCHHVLRWLVNEAAAIGFDPAQIALVGDSAGGQLAAATALRCRDGGLPIRHLGLFYPMIDPDGSSLSRQEFAEGYMLTGSFLDWSWEAYGATSRTLSDPTFNLTQAHLTGLPTTTMITAEFDPLRDEAEHFVDRLIASGVIASLTRFPGMIHGFAGLPQFTPVAAKAIAQMAHAVGATFAGEFPML
jgi:acetyl esterase